MLITDNYRNKIVYYFLSISSSFIILLFYNVLLTRILVPEDYGIYKFILSFLTLCALVFDGGLFSASSYHLANTNRFSREMLGTIIILTFIIGIFFSFFVFISSFYLDRFFNKNVKFIILFVLPLIFIIPYHEIINYIFQGLHKIFQLAFYKVIPRFLALGIVFYFGRYFSRQKGPAYILAIDLLCGTFFVIFLLARLKPSFTGFKTHSLTLIHSIKKFGYKIYIATLFHDAFSHAIVVLTSFFLPLKEVGIYSAAIVICTPILLTGKSFGVVFFQFFAINRFLKKKYLIALICILALEVLFLHYFRINIVYGFFGEQYALITIILPLIAGSLAFQSISRFFYVYFMAIGRGQPCLLINIFFIFSFIFFMALLAPAFRLVGVAISLLLASTISGIIGFICVYSKIK